MHGGSPIVFDFVREIVTGPIFLSAALFLGQRLRPDTQDLPRILFTAFCFFANQACFFLGLKHSNPTVGTTWQTSLPIFTTLIAVAAGQELVSTRTAMGIAIASGGAAYMTLGDYTRVDATSATWHSGAIGHMLFFLQCLAMSGHITASKVLVRKYGSTTLSGWNFSICALLMLGLLLVINAVPGLARFVCGDDDLRLAKSCMETGGYVTRDMVGPLVYEIVCCSLTAWFLLSWANQYAKASVVSIYTVVQPLTSSILSYLLISTRGRAWSSSYGITMPGWHTMVGACLIAIGLFMLFIWKEGPTEDDEEEGSCIER
jgi:drug/metabolite transporter (DMT)-like permease